jgi:hypothetical protein
MKSRGKKGNAYNILKAKQLARPKYRWEDNIKMVVRQIRFNYVV